jgi:hypothetical protein
MSTEDVQPLDQIQPQLKAKFEELMHEILGDKVYDNDQAQEWRTIIMQRSNELVKEITKMQYKFSLTVRPHKQLSFLNNPFLNNNIVPRPGHGV